MPASLDEIRDLLPSLATASDEEVVGALQRNYYPQMTEAEVARRLGVKPPPEPPPPPSSAMRRYLADPAISLAQGVIGLGQIPVGLADLATGGQVGKFLENEGGSIGYRPDEANKILGEYLTPEQKAANAAVQTAGDKEEGLLGKVGATLKAAAQNPSVIPHAVLQSLPSMAAGGVIGRGVVALAPKLAGYAGGIGEGVVTMGQQAEQVRTDEHNPDRLLTGDQSALAGGSGALTGLIGAFSGRLANKLGFENAHSMMAGVHADPAVQRGVVKSALGSMVTEGFLEELPQSVQEQVAQNLALGDPIDKDVPVQAVLGVLTGGAMGFGAGVVGHKSRGDVLREELPPDVGPTSHAARAGIENTAHALDNADLNAPQSGPVPPREATPAMLQAIRDLDPELQPEAVRLAGLGNRMDVTPFVRRYAQTRLDVMLSANGAAEKAAQEQEKAQEKAATEEGAPPPPPLEPHQEPVPVGLTEDDETNRRLRRAAFKQREADKPTPLEVDEIKPGDLTRKDGSPFGSVPNAMGAATRAGFEIDKTHSIVHVPGGIVLRPIGESNVEQPDVAGAAAVAPGPADGPGTDAGGSVATDGPVPGDAGGPVGVPAAAAPAPSSEPNQAVADGGTEKPADVAALPEPAEGMTRIWHGSATHGRVDGPAWFTTNRQYAQSYRKGGQLQYVDWPTEKLNKIADPDGYGQTVEKGFTVHVELDSKDTGLRHIVPSQAPNEAPTSEPAAPPGLRAEDLDPLLAAFDAAKSAEATGWDKAKVNAKDRQSRHNLNERIFVKQAQRDLREGNTQRALDELRGMVGYGEGPGDWARTLRKPIRALLDKYGVGRPVDEPAAAPEPAAQPEPAPKKETAIERRKRLKAEKEAAKKQAEPAPEPAAETATPEPAEEPAEPEPPEDVGLGRTLRDRGEPVASKMDAERRFSAGDRIFAFHEQGEGEAPVEITSSDELKNWAPDQLLALPAEAPGSPRPLLTEKEQLLARFPVGTRVRVVERTRLGTQDRKIAGRVGVVVSGHFDGWYVELDKTPREKSAPVELVLQTDKLERVAVAEAPEQDAAPAPAATSEKPAEAPDNSARPAALIELRKRASVLAQLRKCVAG
jgi:hypothetical protein